MPLVREHCEPCEGKVPGLDPAEANALLAEVPGWRVEDGKLVRKLVMRDFAAVMRLVNRIAEIAEEQQHHPDFRVFGWNKLEITIFTHAIGGLSRNDFVLAAKIGEAATG